MGRRKQKVNVIPEPPVENTVDEIIEVPEEDVVEEVKQPLFTKAKVIANKLHLREEPSKESRSLKILDKDTKVKILDEFGYDNFYNVELEDGTNGFCVKEFIEIVE